MKKFFKMLLQEAVINITDRLTLMSQAVEILERLQTGSSNPEKLMFDIDESDEGYVCHVDEATVIIFNFDADRVLGIVVRDTKMKTVGHSDNNNIGEFTFHDMKGNASQCTAYYSYGVSNFNTEQYFKELKKLADILRFQSQQPVVTEPLGR